MHPGRGPGGCGGGRGDDADGGLVEFDGGLRGMVLNLEEDNVGVAVMGESHGIKGEKCIEQLRKILEGLAEIEDFERKQEFHDESKGSVRRSSQREQRQGGG